VSTPAPTSDPLASRLALAPRTLPEDARRANRSLILRALHHGGPASRADLAKLVGLTPATVSSVVRDLIDAGVVHELGRTSGNIGKPATMIGIEPGGRQVVTISLSEPDRFVGALVDLAGRVTFRREYDRDGRTGDDAVALVRSICDDLLANADRPIAGIGIASPGIVDQHGVVLRAARLDWTKLALADEIALHTGHPTVVANDANAAALAELTFGRSHATDFVLLRIGQGVGAGLVLSGNLYHGSRAAAGEIGHVVVDPDGDACTCGKRGCLETVISAPLLDTRLRDITADERADVLTHAGERLGIALATVLSVLDIADVVLSGPDPVLTDEFRSAAVSAVADRTMPEISEALVVRASATGHDDVVLGAAALLLDRELGIR
jgi:predicted NBD/HSP70 family sugar kinase